MMLPSSELLSKSCISVLPTLPPPWSATASLQCPCTWHLGSLPTLWMGTFPFDSCPQSVPPPAHSFPHDLLSVRVWPLNMRVLTVLSRRRLLSWSARALRGLGSQERRSSSFPGGEHMQSECMIAHHQWRREAGDGNGARWRIRITDGRGKSEALWEPTGGSKHAWHKGEKSWASLH